MIFAFFGIARIRFLATLRWRRPMVTVLGYLIVVAIVLLGVIMAFVIVSLLLGDEESPEIDVRDVEEPLPDGRNVDHNA